MDGEPKASTAGGPDAVFAEARDLLADPRGAEDVQSGISLLDKAAADGCADAIETLALFETMGIARPQSWDRAFDLLKQAAEQGSASARSQLRLLADPKASWEAIQSEADSDWGKLRSAISPGALFDPGDRTVLSEDPRVRVIEGFATPSECRWLMDRARPMLTRATVFKKSGEHGVAEGRTNSAASFRVIEMDVVIEAIRARISAAVRVPLPLFEPTQVFRYEVGQEFRPHHDFLDPANESHHEQLRAGQRIATFLIYLNPDFEGGETEFPAAGIRYRGQAGDAIFWANLDRQNRPDPLTIHAGLPPTSGEKWILSQWIRDRPGAPQQR